VADRSDRSYFKVFWQLQGKSRIEQGRNSADLAPGLWTFYDTSRPYDIELSDSSGFAVLLVPQEKCSRLSLSASGRAGQAFLPSSASRVALAVVMAALREYEEISAPQANAVVDAATDLILSALIDEADRLPSLNGPKYEDVCAYISMRLADETLSPLSIAQAFSVSRRKLYSLFEKNGQSPQAFIQQARLERCRISMIDPSSRWKKITRIAFDHGFNDMAYFSRVFKAAYGLAPRDYRASHVISK
jgi:AraC-like DNA-binding protein